MTTTSSLLTKIRNLPNQRSRNLVLALVCLASMGGYLIYSAIGHHVGFPLDDAWIHQTYARNLAYHGEWAFILGNRSGGSTAPLWSALLALGYVIKLAPFVWTFFLGVSALLALSVLGENAIRKILPEYRAGFPWVGTVIALEWHLVWAAASGMETLLFAFMVTAALILVITGSQKYFGLGILIGLTIWVRPDGITLLGPALVVILLCQPNWMKRLRGLGNFGIGFGSIFALYLLFNLLTSGHPWPNTFYAKQAEYAVYLKLPLLQRLGSESLQPLIGVGLVLLPGLFFEIVSAIRKHAWGVLAAGTWLVGFLALYALRLPVTYQYGRYVMPVMPIYFLLGLKGLLHLVDGSWTGWHWMWRQGWKLLTGIVLISFWGLGVFSYAKDVAYIDNEMVTTAHWVAQNVPADSLIAVHDIGAMGYYGNHDLVDLAGLITPEVIPFIRDQGKLAAYLDEAGVKYLVVFPEWYPEMVAGMQPIFITGTFYPPNSGGSNMAVYRWPSR